MVYHIVFLLIHHMMDIWAFSTLGSHEYNAVNSQVEVSVEMSGFISLGYMSKDGCSVSYAKFMFNFF